MTERPLDAEEKKRMERAAEEGQDTFIEEEGWEEELEEEIGEVKPQKKPEKGEWEEVEPELPDIWMPKVINDELFGKIMSLEEGEYGLFAMIMQKNKEEIQTPCHKYLQSRLKNCMEGDVIRIIYKGEIKASRGRMAENYVIMRRRRA